MPGSEEGRSFFLAIASGRWNSSGKTGRGFSAMKRRIPSGIRFDKAGGMARRRAGRYPCRELYLRRREVKGVLERREADDAGGSTGAARQPARFVAIAGRRGREAILSDKRSVMLRLGDAPAGKADAVPDFQQCLHRPSIRQGRCFGAVRLAFLHAGSVPECPVGRRPQKSPPCGGLRHSRWRTGFRDCPREGARSCLQPGMHAVLSEEGGSEDREEGASRLMREKPLPSMLVSSVAGLRPGPKRQPFLLPCGRRCGGRRR